MFDPCMQSHGNKVLVFINSISLLQEMIELMRNNNMPMLCLGVWLHTNNMLILINWKLLLQEMIKLWRNNKIIALNPDTGSTQDYLVYLSITKRILIRKFKHVCPQDFADFRFALRQANCKRSILTTILWVGPLNLRLCLLW